ncbi:preprotein translocase subunit SecE [Candidatus Nomurabacteria bacterium RIFCSPHIGHO2_02_FULL_41_18]|uniref:Protein translocase subunit SecE n=1 Tax=Candidatus Nomurabacteria bacterium RIFCSPHIGHO2_02_FULL_41_18 TaxID=1801754 RepID=A0A1F6W6A5_9BACT|nr:MAG: preprotein translocase subunit SecE [Candidatus Nomurabacteria bacterium RIFCSPHIGHO2_01_FULL_41_71]OGI77296.1 MAG: preprotein translocase subunit SecE [Candidatus Nomurabacteria bacterium RIFCSPHIGHO2_02_FULL_41_18]OGI89694.1 MAG: preprotein translocase subunit SecE [Candidatus Nomurabacteria bacterium RIFCSPLOWO2_01_FULL_41_52b]OGJ00232.1 MAG: preprotein translocase subunit SecE [Candidatus Nomurabacteria bacterium RIFCSPLOWO2_02_FULL_41_9]
MSKITEYFKETRGELKHVVWPTRKQTFYYTLIVIALSVVLAYYLGVFDFIFGRILGRALVL